MFQLRLTSILASCIILLIIVGVVSSNVVVDDDDGGVSSIIWSNEERKQQRRSRVLITKNEVSYTYIRRNLWVCWGVGPVVVFVVIMSEEVPSTPHTLT